MLLFQGRYAEAVVTFNRLRELAERLRDPALTADACHQLGMAHRLAGQPAAAEQALEEAAQGVVSDLALAGTEGLVRPADNAIEVELGPFIVEGTREDWQLAIDRERADALPLSQLPQATSAAWDGDRTRFPIASSE